MDSFRVALFTGNYNHIRDGVSLTLNRLVRFLEDAGIEVLVFAPSIDEPAIDHEGRMEVVPSTSIPGRPEYRISLRLPKAQREVLQAFDPDIIHIATPDILGLKALRWALRRKKCLITSYHTHFTSYLSYYHLGWLEPVVVRYLKWFYGKSKQVHVPTPSMVEAMKADGFEGDLRVWSRGVDMKLFSPEKRDMDWRRSLGFQDDDLILLFVSRLVWEKNLDIYANAANVAMQRNSRIKPLVVGEGPALEGVQEMLPSAIYTGFLGGEELARAYASSDIFLFPSVTEAFGNVTLEAMACGLPCIVADAVGSKSLVEHGKNGYHVDITRPEQYTEMVCRLAEDDELREGMSKVSLQLAKRFTWNEINGRLLSSYREALNSNDMNR